MKSILCVVDMGEFTPNVLNFAASVAASARTHLFILFSYRLIRGEGNVMVLRRAIEKDAVDKFKVLEEACLKGKDISYEFNPEIGFTGDRIYSHIRRDLVNVIVIGEAQTNSKDEGRRLTLREFMSQQQMPVFVVPEDRTSGVMDFTVARTSAIKL